MKTINKMGLKSFRLLAQKKPFCLIHDSFKKGFKCTTHTPPLHTTITTMLFTLRILMAIPWKMKLPTTKFRILVFLMWREVWCHPMSRLVLYASVQARLFASFDHGCIKNASIVLLLILLRHLTTNPSISICIWLSLSFCLFLALFSLMSLSLPLFLPGSSDECDWSTVLLAPTLAAGAPSFVEFHILETPPNISKCNIMFGISVRTLCSTFPVTDKLINLPLISSIGDMRPK